MPPADDRHDDDHVTLNGETPGANIIIDSNVIVPEYRLDGARTRILLRSLPSTPHTLHVPQLVIDEVAGTVQKKLIRTKRDLEDKASHQNNRRLPINMGAVLPIPSLNTIYEQVDSYRNWLTNALVDHGAHITDYPRATHQDLVRRISRGRRPFQMDKDDEGYRDTLMWESVIDLAHNVQGDIVFVGLDTKAYAIDENLHPDLIEDLVNHGIDAERLKYFSDFGLFADHYLAIHAELEEVRGSLVSGHSLGKPMADILRLIIGTDIQGYELQSGNAILTTSVLSAMIMDVLAIKDFQLAKLIKLASGEFWAEFSAIVTCSFELEMQVNGNHDRGIGINDFAVRITVILDEGIESIKHSTVTSVQHLRPTSGEPLMTNAQKEYYSNQRSSNVNEHFRMREHIVETFRQYGAQVTTRDLLSPYRPWAKMLVIGSWRTFRIAALPRAIDSSGYGPTAESYRLPLDAFLRESGVDEAIIVVTGETWSQALTPAIRMLDETSFVSYIESRVLGGDASE